MSTHSKSVKLIHDILFTRDYIPQPYEINNYVFKIPEWESVLKRSGIEARILAENSSFPGHWINKTLQSKHSQLPTTGDSYVCLVSSIYPEIINQVKYTFDIFKPLKTEYLGLFKAYLGKDVGYVKDKTLTYWDNMLELFDLSALTMRDFVDDPTLVHKSIPSAERIGYIDWFSDALAIKTSENKRVLNTHYMLCDAHFHEMRLAYTKVSNILVAVKEVIQNLVLDRVPARLLQ